MKLINSHLAESIEEQGMLATPNALGYIFIGAEIEPTLPFRKSEKKTNYLYILTTKGISEKTKLTLNFMKRKFAEYEELKKEIESDK